MPSLSPWYEIVATEELQQGDLFPNCPVVLTPTTLNPRVNSEPPSAIAAQVRLYNVIVMSQSCDLVQRKLDLVLVCPYWGLTELEAMDARFKSPRLKEEVRRGNVPA